MWELYHFVKRVGIATNLGEGHTYLGIASSDAVIRCYASNPYYRQAMAYIG